MLYVVVSDDYYGGCLGIFDNIVDADNYRMKLSDKGRCDTKRYDIEKLPFKLLSVPDEKGSDVDDNDKSNHPSVDKQ